MKQFGVLWRGDHIKRLQINGPRSILGTTPASKGPSRQLGPPNDHTREYPASARS
jgi:hypothetical protein